MKMLATLLLRVGLLAPGLSAQANLCGRAEATSFGLARVYCIPDLSPFGAFFRTGPAAQIWIQSRTTIAQSYSVVLGYHFAGLQLNEHRMIWGGGVIATSFFLPALQPTSVFIWELSSGRNATIN
jgi:hypothetical protein